MLLLEFELKFSQSQSEILITKDKLIYEFGQTCI